MSGRGGRGRPERPRSGSRPERGDGVDEAVDRGLHDLAGDGAPTLSVSRAMRARDVNRPDVAELADAERTVQIVRRGWTPTG